MMDSTLKHTQHPACAPDATTEVPRWTQILARYREPCRVRSVTELVITIVPLVLLWILMWATARPRLLVLPAARRAGGRLPRAPLHDPARLRPRRRSSAIASTNDWVGRVIGVLTLTPYDFWRRTHAHPPCELGQSRSPRHRRHRHADGTRISGAVALGAGFAIACTGTRS